MPRQVVIPVLGGDGWVTDPKRALSTLFAYAIAAQYSQSDTYNGNVTSIPYYVALYQNDPFELTAQVEQALRTYYTRHFPTCTVDVSYIDSTVNVGGYTLLVSITVTVNGATYSLSVKGDVTDGILSNVLTDMNQ